EFSAVTASYWDSSVNAVGIASGNTAGAQGLTGNEMRAMSSFADWDITASGGGNTVWRIYEGHTNPLLASFLTDLALADVAMTYDGLTHNGVTTLIGGVLGGAAIGRNSGSYSGYYSGQQGYDLAGGNLTIAKAELIITGLTVSDKVYDASTVAILGGSATVTGFGSDDVFVTGIGSGQFADKNVGTGKTITVSGNTL